MRNAISIDMIPSQSAWYSIIYPLSVCVCVCLNEMTFALRATARCGRYGRPGGIQKIRQIRKTAENTFCTPAFSIQWVTLICILCWTTANCNAHTLASYDCNRRTSAVVDCIMYADDIVIIRQLPDHALATFCRVWLIFVGIMVNSLISASIP